MKRSSWWRRICGAAGNRRDFAVEKESRGVKPRLREHFVARCASGTQSRMRELRELAEDFAGGVEELEMR